MADYNQSPSGLSRLMPRLIIAGIIAVIGWMMYAHQVEENPVTGEKQHVAISPNQEISLGLESAPQMSREMGGELPASDPRTQEVIRIGQLLVDKSNPKNSPWKFQFHLLADPKTVNAFALPGGQVFITLGLLNRLQTEAQLAGVLGHEIGHVIERHTAQQMAKSQLGKWLVMAVGVGGQTESSSNNASNPMVIAAMVNQVLQLRYGRLDESQADIWGIKMTENAGYDPRAMIAVMKVLKDASGGGAGLEMFQTHPNPDLRMEQIEEYLKKNPPPEGLSEGRNLKAVYGQITTPKGNIQSGDDLQKLIDQLFK
jgi:predicted Zn-dependent protease